MQIQYHVVVIDVQRVRVRWHLLNIIVAHHYINNVLTQLHLHALRLRLVFYKP